jgi:hypothetical protein
MTLLFRIGKLLHKQQCHPDWSVPGFPVERSALYRALAPDFSRPALKRISKSNSFPQR